MENPNIKNVLQTLAESFSENSAIKKVYGEPIIAQGKTIITVAKVAQGFGGGFGEKNGKADNPADAATAGTNPAKADAAGGGGGMGGGMSVTPVGFIEITDEKTRFIRFDKSRYVALGAALGVLISMLWHSGSNGRLKPQKEATEKLTKKDKKKKR